MKKSMIIIMAMVVAAVFSATAFADELEIWGRDKLDSLHKIINIKDGRGYIVAGVTNWRTFTLTATSSNNGKSKKNSGNAYGWGNGNGNGHAYAYGHYKKGSSENTTTTTTYIDGISADTNEYIAEVDIDGAVVWELNSGTDYDDKFIDVLEDSDGGFILLGMDNGQITLTRVVVINGLGEVEWRREIGAVGAVGNGLALASDGSIFVAGTINGSIYLLKSSSGADGSLVFETTFESTGSDSGNAVKVAANGDILIAGASAGYTHIVRANYSGAKIWRYSYAAGELVSILEKSGNIVAAGSVTGIGAGGYDAYLLGLKSTGTTKIFEKTFGKTKDEYGRALIPTTDGGYALLIETGKGVIPSGTAMYLAKTDLQGREQWGKLVGTSDGAYPSSLCQFGYEYVLVGYTGVYSAQTIENQFFLNKFESM